MRDAEDKSWQQYQEAEASEQQREAADSARRWTYAKYASGAAAVLAAAYFFARNGGGAADGAPGAGDAGQVV